MPIALKEFVEFIRMRENVRRNVHTLEMCSHCQKICECRRSFDEDGNPEWLCAYCMEEAKAE